MTISNHVNFEKLLLKIFDTKYKSKEVGMGGIYTGNFNGMLQAGEDLSQHVVLKERNPTTGVKEAATESYGINIIMSRYDAESTISKVNEEVAKCVVAKYNKR